MCTFSLMKLEPIIDISNETLRNLCNELTIITETIHNTFKRPLISEENE